VKKTSVYLSDEDRDRLNRLAEREGKSQALVLREALAFYDANQPDRNFAIFDAFAGRGLEPLPHFKTPQEFQDYVDDVLMKGFGEDSLGDYE
jgi:hypothetical protein